MAKVKGITLLGRKTILANKYGQDVLEKVLSAMKPEHREAMGAAIASSWYEGEIFKDFNECIRKTLQASDPDVMEHIGEMMADAGLKGVYSSRLKDGDVSQTLSRAASLWKTFHDTGELTMESESGSKKAILRIEGYALPHRENCRNLLGWGRRMVELSGGSNVKVAEHKCVCKGDDICEMSVEWE